MKKSVILFSGGLDSSTCLAIAIKEGFEVYALTVNYSQRHLCEIDKSKQICDKFDVKEHKIVSVDLRSLGGSALTDDIDVPRNRPLEDIDKYIPSTYVPLRNVTLLSIAAGWAEIIDADAIYAGMNAVDYSGYPDCRPEFIESFKEVLSVGTKRGVEGNPPEIITPLMYMKKSDIIKKGISLGLDYSLTWSCYSPVKRNKEWYACGRCDACRLRLKGFYEAGLEDPLPYADNLI